MSDLVGNPEDRFSHVAAQMLKVKCIYFTCCTSFDDDVSNKCQKFNSNLLHSVFVLHILGVHPRWYDVFTANF